ncbi:SurA N-terminal domain-containing protein [Candidatus Kryptonium thompsonii]|uniref:SurA N-terminal domain-containing protein n=4 Tax=Candidatus Kryptonium thompsonii TaxID=1633631 RepID=A0A0P1LXI9_9BACT|nr:SurA N-terminal domain-containing protein [Candidatus Kryptonium thompsoni]CUS78685.1 SurA N-terminal domain-containing protein [Candidatus Kryptonium thompsoni]CUS80616.1 SurA N-terminal domain-containing protein [Candidatus Kryptonium thompsoni]CUS85661.1 SurA N-terminal domain-containing protein [Candidatus Kryptonium thompsoni]CUS86822.1 SurA N-terminal domain-containing protein [Candidatus Kryptonium thompsoni]
MKNIALTLLICLTTIGFSQNFFKSEIKNDTIAKVGDKAITVRDFIERYELTVWRGKEKKTQVDKNKLEFLYSMIAEKLLAFKGLELGLDKDPEIQRAIQQTEKLLVLDALYKQEIKNKVSVSEREILEALPKYNTEVELHYIIAETKEKADSLWNLLKGGEDFDSLMVKLGQKNNSEKLRWGEIYEPIEKIVYDYLSVGEVYQPVQVDSLWYIIKLAGKSSKFGLSPDEIESAKSQVRKIIQERKEKQRFIEFVNEFGKGKILKVDAHLLKLLYREINNIVEKKKYVRKAENVSVYPLAVLRDDFLDIKSRLAGFLDQYFLKGDSFNRTLDYVIDQLSFKGFVLHSDRQSVSGVLNGLLKTIINEEFLAFEGYRRGLDKSPEVLKDMEMWRDAYLAYAVKKLVLDSLKFNRSISAEELLKSYRPTTGDIWEIKIQEILVNDIDLADSLLNLVKSGYDMGELARRFSKREIARENDGIIGYVLSNQLGEIGQIAGTLEIGEVYGPLYTEEGYSIFKLIDKRKPKDTLFVVNYDTFGVVLNKLIASLADEYGVSVKPEILKAVEVTYINTIVVRFLGFNNRILAVPLLERNVDWLRFIKKKNLPLP